MTFMYKWKEKDTDKSLKSLEEDLCWEWKPFIRIHRNALVRKDKINKLVETSDGKFKVILNGWKKMEVSRGHKSAVRDIVKKNIEKHSLLINQANHSSN